MRKEIKIPYQQKSYADVADQDERAQKSEEKESIEAIFVEEIKEQ